MPVRGVERSGRLVRENGGRIGHDGASNRDLLSGLPSLIRRVCSGYAPMWGVLRTQSV
jgi:hypothetical protein